MSMVNILITKAFYNFFVWRLVTAAFTAHYKCTYTYSQLHAINLFSITLII